MATPNLAIIHIAASQNQKEVTANTAFDDLDLALTDFYPVTITDADYTFSNPEALTHMVYKISGALTANRNVVVPNNKKMYVVSNNTSGGHNITVKTSAGTGISLSSTAFVVLYCDGTNVIALAASASGGATIDASQIVSGQVALARGGTHADLSATGGAHKFLRQATSGANIDVVQPANTDLTEYGNGDLVGQTADVALTTLGTPLSNGRYRVSGYIIVTTVDGASSTLPSIVITWTDPDNNTAQSFTLTATSAGNLLTTKQSADVFISAKSGVAVQFNTTGYTSGTPATMQFAIHLTIERL